MEGAPATGQTGSKRGGIDVNCQNTRIQELAFLKPTETTALFHPRFSSGYKTLRWTILQRRAPGPTPWGLGFGAWRWDFLNENAWVGCLASRNAEAARPELWMVKLCRPTVARREQGTS